MRLTGSRPFKFDRQVPIYNWYYPSATDPVPDLDFSRSMSLLRHACREPRRSRALYLHVPFCETVCTFCPFVRGRYDNDDIVEAYTQALIREIELKAEPMNAVGTPIGAIFVGGGTPSILSPAQIGRIGAALNKHFDLSGLHEFSFEMEVKTVDEARIQALVAIGVTHLRFGLQTFDPLYRRLFNLTSSVDDIYRAVSLMKKHVKHVSFDMLYGMNGQTMDGFIEDILAAQSLGTPLIDVYPINNVMTQTKLHRAFRDHAMPATSARTKFAMNVMLEQLMRDGGYAPHNGHGYVRLGEEAAATGVVTDRYSFRYHEYVYGYDDVDLIGFGANAISSTGRFIVQNAANRKRYIQRVLEDGEWDMEIGVADPRSNASRPVILALPYHGRLDARRVDWSNVYPETLERLDMLVDGGFFTVDADGFEITRRGWLWYTNIMYYLLPGHERAALDGYITSAMEDRDRRIEDIETRYLAAGA